MLRCLMPTIFLLLAHNWIYCYKKICGLTFQKVPWTYFLGVFLL